MIFRVSADGWLEVPATDAGPVRRLRCALGPSGVVAAEDKREGDGATPAGTWPIRRVLFRPDRGPAPRTGLPVQAIGPHDGWCDAPEDEAYNRPVTLPYPASAEAMWREDGLYDLIAVLGFNDAPPAPGRGSAIFLHVAKPAYEPTQGCVALARADLEQVLAFAGPGSALLIEGPG
jgi:L,D-peptidoglycan transpeptidase YkuD (ErfK/YbiS/YcfS/YnhG family)